MTLTRRDPVYSRDGHRLYGYLDDSTEGGWRAQDLVGLLEEQFDHLAEPRDEALGLIVRGLMRALHEVMVEIAEQESRTPVTLTGKPHLCILP